MQFLHFLVFSNFLKDYFAVCVKKYTHQNLCCVAFLPSKPLLHF